MTFCLQTDLWAPAYGYYLQLITRCGWHRCHARLWGLGWDCQYPPRLETTGICACLWRDPHQRKVAALSCPLLCQRHNVRRTWVQGYPHTTSACYSHPISLHVPSANTLQGPAERLRGERLGSCHCFLAASSLTYLKPAFTLCSAVFLSASGEGREGLGCHST